MIRHLRPHFLILEGFRLIIQLMLSWLNAIKSSQWCSNILRSQKRRDCYCIVELLVYSQAETEALLCAVTSRWPSVGITVTACYATTGQHGWWLHRSPNAAHSTAHLGTVASNKKHNMDSTFIITRPAPGCIYWSTIALLIKVTTFSLLAQIHVHIFPQLSSQFLNNLQ